MILNSTPQYFDDHKDELRADKELDNFLLFHGRKVAAECQFEVKVQYFLDSLSFMNTHSYMNRRSCDEDKICNLTSIKKLFTNP